jgi:beta-mannosidase
MNITMKKTGMSRPLFSAAFAATCMSLCAFAEVREQNLAGEWRLENATNAAFTCAIEVPGGVHSALLKAGLMKDPYWGRNEIDTQWVAKHAWRIERSFVVSRELLARRAVILRLEDCDTFWTVYVN